GALLLADAARAQNAMLPPVDYHLQEAKFRSDRMLDEHGQMPTNAWLNALQEKRQMQFDPKAWPGTAQGSPAGSLKPNTAGIDSGSWTWLGPGNIGGRIRSILVNPTNSNILWTGGVGGGVWKTLNGGASWFPLDDFMGNLAIGCLLLDPTNPNVIYAGTGEGFSNADGLRGAGIFKSSDGGATWNQLPSSATSSFYFVNRLAISPTNNLALLAATGTGIWRSTDGGLSWSQRFSAVAILDVAFNPLDGSKAIASGSTYGVVGRVLYSSDGGLTWTSATGLPASGGRIDVAYAPSNPLIVYASANNNSGEVYMSADGGATFALRSTPAHLSGQGWYDNCIWVDPTNPNLVLIGGLDIWRSTDGGATFTDIGGYSGGIHPDQHAIVNAAGYDGVTVKTVFIGNDGGFFRATDVTTVTPGSGWTTLNNNLGITQFYGAAGNNASGTIVGGTQDNGTERYTPGGGPQGYSFMFGGDGGFCAADQTNPNYFYGEYVYLQIHRSSNGGLSSSYITAGLGDAGVPGGGGDPDGDGPGGDPDASANFIAPFILDPNNYNTMLAGGSNLWR
ncbi:MAG: WD40/YVTN/BNR-like repeat-containing protein, partial [Limisphaerales bacterium]